MGKIEYSLARLVELLKDANKCVDDYKDGLNTMNKKYNNLHDDYIALRYSDIWAECQKVSDSA